eukprot:jgi/Mesvir1/26490/Mv16156-RA.1
MPEFQSVLSCPPSQGAGSGGVAHGVGVASGVKGVKGLGSALLGPTSASLDASQVACLLRILCHADVEKEPDARARNRILLEAVCSDAFMRATLPWTLREVGVTPSQVVQVAAFCALVLRHLPQCWREVPLGDIRDATDGLVRKAGDGGGDPLLATLQSRVAELRDLVEESKRLVAEGGTGGTLTRNMTLGGSSRPIRNAGQSGPWVPPPQSHRELSVVPAASDLVRRDAHMRANVVGGVPWQCTEHYLDTTFRLMRENFLQPLREAIAAWEPPAAGGDGQQNDNRGQARKDMKRVRDDSVSVYHDVRVAQLTAGKGGELVLFLAFRTATPVDYNDSHALQNGNAVFLVQVGRGGEGGSPEGSDAAMGQERKVGGQGGPLAALGQITLQGLMERNPPVLVATVSDRSPLEKSRGGASRGGRGVGYGSSSSRAPVGVTDGFVGVTPARGAGADIGNWQLDGTYLMLESVVFWPAVEPVLRRLRALTADDLPFPEALVSLQGVRHTPLYIRSNPNLPVGTRDAPELPPPPPPSGGPSVGFTGVMERVWSRSGAGLFRAYPQRTMDVVYGWPMDYNSAQVQEWQPIPDEFQYEAVRHILTHQVSLVQGPPGTGKTFTTVIAVQLMAAAAARAHRPLLVITYTNHALDQILVKLASAIGLDGIVRMGGTLKDESLRDCTIQEVSKRPPAPRGNYKILRGKVDNMVVDIDRTSRHFFAIKDALDACEELRQVTDAALSAQPPREPPGRQQLGKDPQRQHQPAEVFSKTQRAARRLERCLVAKGSPLKALCEHFTQLLDRFRLRHEEEGLRIFLEGKEEAVYCAKLAEDRAARRRQREVERRHRERETLWRDRTRTILSGKRGGQDENQRKNDGRVNGVMIAPSRGGPDRAGPANAGPGQGLKPFHPPDGVRGAKLDDAGIKSGGGGQKEARRPGDLGESAREGGHKNADTRPTWVTKQAPAVQGPLEEHPPDAGLVSAGSAGASETSKPRGGASVVSLDDASIRFAEIVEGKNGEQQGCAGTVTTQPANSWPQRTAKQAAQAAMQGRLEKHPQCAGGIVSAGSVQGPDPADLPASASVFNSGTNLDGANAKSGEPGGRNTRKRKLAEGADSSGPAQWANTWPQRRAAKRAALDTVGQGLLEEPLPDAGRDNAGSVGGAGVSHPAAGDNVKFSLASSGGRNGEQPGLGETVSAGSGQPAETRSEHTAKWTKRTAQVATVQVPVVQGPSVQGPVLQAAVQAPAVTQATRRLTRAKQAATMQASTAQVATVQVPVVQAPSVQGPVLQAAVQAPAVTQATRRLTRAKQAATMQTSTAQVATVQVPVVQAPSVQGPVMQAAVQAPAVTQATRRLTRAKQAATMQAATAQVATVQVPVVQGPSVQGPVMQAAVQAPAVTQATVRPTRGKQAATMQAAAAQVATVQVPVVQAPSVQGPVLQAAVQAPAVTQATVRPTRGKQAETAQAATVQASAAKGLSDHAGTVHGSLVEEPQAAPHVSPEREVKFRDSSILKLREQRGVIDDTNDDDDANDGEDGNGEGGPSGVDVDNHSLGDVEVDMEGAEKLPSEWVPYLQAARVAGARIFPAGRAPARGRHHGLVPANGSAGRRGMLRLGTAAVVAEGEGVDMAGTLQGDDSMEEPDVPALRQCSFPWNVPHAKRLGLLVDSLRSAKESLAAQLARLMTQQDALKSRLTAIRRADNLAILRRAAVVGMTTTKAAGETELLMQLNPAAVVVEECGELLEGQLLACLPKDLEHLVLVGDHEQLRPRVECYELERQHNIHISMFERLITPRQTALPPAGAAVFADASGAPWPAAGVVDQHADAEPPRLAHVRLKVQKRMRPEVSRLVRLFYPDLRDHPSMLSVRERPEVSGVCRSVAMVCHEHPESGELSKTNTFEAAYVAALAGYLIAVRQFKPREVTIIAAYLGQRYLIVQHLTQLGVRVDQEDLNNPRIVTIDDYQGEENEVILLSLVRSNKHQPTPSLGFMKVRNRIIVALSRARCGLFILANGTMFARNEHWSRVIIELQAMNAYFPPGVGLELSCPRHPDQRKVARVPGDFKTVSHGGCAHKCARQLACGHVCPDLCHPQQAHDEVACEKPCALTHRECGHRCQAPCYKKPCPPCRVAVQRVLPECGHVLYMLCCDDPTTIRCRELITVGLPCGHTRYQVVCSERASATCREPCPVTVVNPGRCGRPCALECFHAGAHTCGLRCKNPLMCAHVCTQACGNCNPHECECLQPCEYRCRHAVCRESCASPCVCCMEPCEWACPHKGGCTRLCHEVCDREPCNEPCREKVCKKGHRCAGLCGEPCPPCVHCDLPPDWSDPVALVSKRELDVRQHKLYKLECNHVFLVETLDGYMGAKGNEVALKGCPVCRRVIYDAPRYGDFIKRNRLAVEEVKLIIRRERQAVEQARRMAGLHGPSAHMAALTQLPGVTRWYRCTRCACPFAVGDCGALNEGGACSNCRMRIGGSSGSLPMDGPALEGIARGMADFDLRAAINATRADRGGPLETAGRHWFTCPNGHTFFFGDGDDAMEHAICPECSAQIGGDLRAKEADSESAEDVDMDRYSPTGDVFTP